MTPQQDFLMIWKQKTKQMNAKQRLEFEYMETTERLQGLQKFLSSPQLILNFTIEELQLLEEQSNYMEKYVSILKIRLDNWKDK